MEQYQTAPTGGMQTFIKMPSAEVVCCFFLLELFDLCKYRGQQCGSISDCSYRGSLIWVHTVCLKAKIFQQTTKKTTSVVIGTLKVNIIGIVGNY